MDKDYIVVTGIEITKKGIKISYIDRMENKTLCSPEAPRMEFWDAEKQLGKEALLLPNFGALNEKEIEKSEELGNLNKLMVEKMIISMDKDMRSVVTLRILLELKDGVETTIILEKIEYSLAGEHPFDKAIVKYKEEAKKYLKGERAQKSLFEEPEKDAKQEAANG